MLLLLAFNIVMLFLVAFKIVMLLLVVFFPISTSRKEFTVGSRKQLSCIKLPSTETESILPFEYLSFNFHSLVICPLAGENGLARLFLLRVK